MTNSRFWRIGIPVGLYLIATALTMQDALTSPIRSDRLLEFAIFTDTLAGTTSFSGGLVSSSLTATWVPAKLAVVFGLDSTLTFKVFPCFVFSLMPMFAYFIARRYVGVTGALLSATLILSNFYFAYNSNMGRVSIAWGLLSIVLWAALSRQYIVAIIAFASVVLSHYGTAFIALFVTIAYLAVSWIENRSKPVKEHLLTYLLVVVLLVGSTYVWFGVVAPSTGGVVQSFIRDSIGMRSRALEEPKFVKGAPEEQRERIIREFAESTPAQNFMKLESREPATQAALGASLPYMNTPQRIEWGVSWVTVVLTSIGLLGVGIGLRRNGPHRRIPFSLWCLAVVFYSLTVMTVLIPHISVYYGSVRVWFTGQAALSMFFVVGGRSAFGGLGRYRDLPTGAVVVLYGLTVSGILHGWFGIVKC